MSSSKNKIFETTSFLSGANSSYIDELYDKFVKDPNSIQESWREFFLGLAENKELIKKNTQGASWSPEQVKNIQNNNLDRYENLLPKINVLEIQEKVIKLNSKEIPDNFNIETATKDSVRAIMMIRAYRIRGHLIADLDPLGLTSNY